MDKFLKFTVTIFIFIISFMLTIVAYYFIFRNNDGLTKRLNRYFPPSSELVDATIEVDYE